MSHLRLALVLWPLLTACASSQTRVAVPPPTAPTAQLEPVPAGELRRPVSYSLLAVLVPPGKEAAPFQRAIEAAAQKINRPVTQNSDDLAEGALFMEVVPVDQLVSLADLELSSMGLEDAELIDLQASTTAITMVLAGPAEMLGTVQRQAADVARAALKEGGWLYDGGVMQVYTAAKFDELRPSGFPLEAERLVMVMVDDSTERARVETLGMARLGVPELRIIDIPLVFLEGAIDLLNAAAQLVIEQANVERTGELVIDLKTALMPRLREASEAASRAGGGEAVTVAAWWDAPLVGGEEGEPVIRLDLLSAEPSRDEAFGELLRRIFGPSAELVEAD